MPENEKGKIERFQKKVLRLVKNLELGAIFPIEFCGAFNEIVVYAFQSGLSEETFRPCVESMPRALLKLLSDWGGLIPAGDIRPTFNVLWQDGGEKATRLRQLFAMIDEQLKGCGERGEGEAEYNLPERLAGDPRPSYWGVSEPYTAADLAMRMERYIQEADAASREWFEAMRASPERMALFDEQDREPGWLVGRAGQRVLLFNHECNSLEIGWVLSTGKVWRINFAHSLQEALKRWPEGPVSPDRWIDMGDFGVGRLFKMVVAAYGPLENSEVTRRLLRDKIDFYLEQADFSDRERKQDPIIILACDMPPNPDLGEFLEEIRRRVEGQRVKFEFRTRAFGGQ